MADYTLGDVMDSMRRNIDHLDVVLNGTNYLAWKLTIRWLLDGLWVLSHVNGTTTVSAAPFLPNSSNSSLDDADVPPPVTPALIEAYEKKLEK